MTLSEDFQRRAQMMHGHLEDSPAWPGSEDRISKDILERAIFESNAVALLLSQVQRLAAEVDKLREAVGGGDGNGGNA
jgi:hypothetical protein